MKFFICFMLPVIFGFTALKAQEKYPLTEDSKVQPGVPRGEIRGPFKWTSNIFPGTERQYWIYVPRQYDSSKKACVMVVQDGLACAEGLKLPTVLDNLISKKEIPVMIGIFISWGYTPGTDTAVYGRFNRSFEYDATGNRYARFLTEEILPEVRKKYSLSEDPNDFSIAGESSGAICAYNVAWERPDVFRRVFSAIGSFVGLRGGEEIATLIRKSEPKPIRIFMQDGTSDLNIYAGDWWLANQNVFSALNYAKYDVNHVWGEEGHNKKQSSAILPDALRWLWKDYPSPVEKRTGADYRIKLLVDGEDWKLVPTGTGIVDKLMVGTSGDVLYTEQNSGALYRATNPKSMVISSKKISKPGGICQGANGKLYLFNHQTCELVEVDQAGKTRGLLKNTDGDYLLAATNGLYFTSKKQDLLGFYHFDSGKTFYYHDVPHPVGLAMSSEQTFLNIGSATAPFGYSYKIEADGSLTYCQPYIHYHFPYGETTPGAEGMAVDADNNLYTATSLGVQVSDQLGRVNFIFSLPTTGRVSDVKLGGEGGNKLFVNCGGKLYKRTIQAKALLPGSSPVKPPKPGL